jgi:Tfp pilus assembly protein PilO
MSNSNTKKILFTLITVLIVIIATNIIGVFMINNQKTEVVELKKEISRESAKNYSVTDLKQQILILKNLESKLDDIYVDRGEIVIFIEQLEQISKNIGTDLQIKNVNVETVKDVKENELHGNLDMVLQVDGSWSKVTKFLTFIESMPNYIVIDNMRFNTITGAGGESLWSLSLSMKVITN